MPPKSKFSKEEILAAAVGLTRRQGIEALTARALAQELGTSPKPIFGWFSSMAEIHGKVMEAAEGLYQQYLREDMAAGVYPPYKASGMAYIRFAREERELFKLLFMRDRTGESIGEDRESIRPLLDLLMKNLGISEDTAYLLHLELWVYVHGIATMIATGYLDWDLDFISRTLTDVYAGLKERFAREERHESH